MPFDEGMAKRLREIFEGRDDVVEKKMFGGIAFMHENIMCCGIVTDTLMARVGPDNYQSTLARPHAREMDFTGKALKGFVYVGPAGFADDVNRRRWAELLREIYVVPAGQIRVLSAIQTSINPRQ